MSRKRFATALAVLILVCALIAPAISIAPAAANPDVELYFRIEGPADAATFTDTGEYQTIWAGNINVPGSVNITTTSGNTWHLYVNDSNRYIAECVAGDRTGQVYDRGEADRNTGATSVLAALHQASIEGSFTYEILDTQFPGMGFFISTIGEHKGSGALGWNYRVWNPDHTYIPSLASDMFLLGYNSTALAVPHEQVLFYWGSTSNCYPLKVTSDKATVEVSEKFTATVEYYRDIGWTGTGIWEKLAGATIDVADETFTTDDNGEATIYLEAEGTYYLTSSRGCNGGTYYTPSDDRTGLTVSGGDTYNHWTQTTQGDFASGIADKVDTSTNPGDVRLEREGTVSQNYTLNSGTDTLGGEYFFDEFKIINGATLYVSPGEILRVHANYIKVDVTSTINANGRGYNGGEGGTENGEDGFGMGNGSRGAYNISIGGGGGGAGHNDVGGNGSPGWTTDLVATEGSGGYKYGKQCWSTGNDSFYMGSGGGGGAGNGTAAGGDGGKGGGAVVLECMDISSPDDTILINGTITAKGENGANGLDDGCGGGGGGSGGTILIKGKNIFIANDSLSVAAGDGGDQGGTGGGGGGGGTGGHIKVFYENCDSSIEHDIDRGLGGIGTLYDGEDGTDGSGDSRNWWYQYETEPYSPVLPYNASGTLISAIYDTGYTGTKFGKLHWCATILSGTDLKFQIAASNDTETWDFKGPDGSMGTFYTVSGTDIWSGHNNSRYIRYKVFLSTTEPGKTAILSKVSISYTTGGAGEIISFTVTDHDADGINFGSLKTGSDNNPEGAQNSTHAAITVTTGNETNVDCIIQIRGSGNFSDGNGHTIALNNAKWNTSNDPGSATNMSISYAAIGTTNATIEESIDIWHWVDIPDGQASAFYQTDFYYQAVKDLT